MEASFRARDGSSHELRKYSFCRERRLLFPAAALPEKPLKPLPTPKALIFAYFRPNGATAPVHNPLVAAYLDLQVISKKCPSFRPLVKFIVGHRRIQLPAQPFPGTATRSLWTYTDPGNRSQYVGQLATAHEWGEVIIYAQGLDPQPEELTRLCEYGWAELTTLETELQAILTESKPKARVRAALMALRGIAADRKGARHIGLDDGAR